VIWVRERWVISWCFGSVSRWGDREGKVVDGGEKRGRVSLERRRERGRKRLFEY